uniref:Uncharacterized protein n=1 Tax=Tetraselmis sp. GSL018 TaxID=582737 RepID=A0A061QZL2_9CHLO|mmetsp:Transcript_2437/g.5777  ORF Transcript_2437/g.5777 Transcript_2437/m.5777 type:complete len:138 (+) Transcript_2437:347-760(+)
MTRIDALKLPRSGLTETMRSFGQSGRVSDSRQCRPSLEAGQGLPADLARPEDCAGTFPLGLRSSSRAGAPTGIGSEIRSILGSGSAQAVKSSPVFGCSPPSRAVNPLSRDSKFKSCRIKSTLNIQFMHGLSGNADTL